MKVLCINDSNRPEDIPTSKWVKKGQIYTVSGHAYCTRQQYLLGLKLEELDISNCFPYQYFAADRFVPAETPEQLEEIGLETADLAS